MDDDIKYLNELGAEQLAFGLSYKIKGLAIGCMDKTWYISAIDLPRYKQIKHGHLRAALASETRLLKKESIQYIETLIKRTSNIPKIGE